MSDTGYWIVGGDNGSGRDRKLHTDRDCYNLEKSHRVKEATEAYIEEFDLCKVCSGDADKSTHSWDHQRALREAASQ